MPSFEQDREAAWEAGIRPTPVPPAPQDPWTLLKVKAEKENINIDVDVLKAAFIERGFLSISEIAELLNVNEIYADEIASIMTVDLEMAYEMGDEIHMMTEAFGHHVEAETPHVGIADEGPGKKTTYDKKPRDGFWDRPEAFSEGALRKFIKLTLSEQRSRK